MQIPTSFAPRIVSRFAVRAGQRERQSPPPRWTGVIENLNFVAALEENDYDYKYVFGGDDHHGHHGGMFFPATMRCPWRDYGK